MNTFRIGDKVELYGVKDAVITSIVKVNKKKPENTMYMVEYAVDDDLARETGETRRNTQPWFGYQLKVC